tara:strand:+ start:7318 stop:8457 length:1140 start_codon:yes stop_codon:yes gene_type:complete
MIQKYDTLYIIDSKHKKRQWVLNVTDTSDGVRISRTYGVVDGKQTTVSTLITSGKNIGKANETTPWGQAIKQANAMFAKQSEDLGYSKTPDDNTANIKPMLAHTYFDKNGNPDKNKDKHIKVPFYMQPKLDGVRMLVGKNLDGTPVVMSRTGKPMYNMDHITNELVPRLQSGEFIDGENFTFDLTFEEITGICRTSKEKHAENKQCQSIRFHAFDTFHLSHMDVPFNQRMKRLDELTHNTNNTIRVDTITVTSKNDIKNILGEYLQKGYEGGMIRNTNGEYKLDARSNDLQKVKYFVAEEFIICGFIEADGRDKGTVIWECENEKGKFKVRPRGSIEVRKEWFTNGKKYIGKQLTVQYQNMTENGFPRFPVGIAIRDYE